VTLSELSKKEKVRLEGIRTYVRTSNLEPSITT
jgi:hypothetical protein